MAKGRLSETPRRGRMTVNVPGPIWAWFRRFVLTQTSTNTRAVSAGVAALRFLDNREREAMLSWATLIDEGRATWEQFEDFCLLDQKARTQALAEALDRAISHEIEELGGRPRSRGKAANRA